MKIRSADARPGYPDYGVFRMFDFWFLFVPVCTNPEWASEIHRDHKSELFGLD
jgi:hypothetical protein